MIKSDMKPDLFIHNIHLITPGKIIQNGFLRTRGGKIETLGYFTGIPTSIITLDGQGGWLAPGFIDLQVNGGFGYDFTADPGSIWDVAARLPQFGVTSFLPTIVTSPRETIDKALNIFLEGGTGPAGSVALGLHIEGPFLNPKKKGTHNPKHLRTPENWGWSRTTGARLVTLAPELSGALELAQTLRDRGVVVSAGHSMATFAQTKIGFEHGIRYGTHLFNAMRPVHHREPGIIGALLDDERATVGLIPDGVHVHPSLVRLVWEVLGLERLNLVTDAMAALGMPPGDYILGETKVIVTETDSRLPDGALAGSIVTMDAALRNLIAYTGASLPDALQTITSTPARLLGEYPGKGALQPGSDADLVILSEKLEVKNTIINGEIVYP